MFGAGWVGKQPLQIHSLGCLAVCSIQQEAWQVMGGQKEVRAREGIPFFFGGHLQRLLLCDFRFS